MGRVTVRRRITSIDVGVPRELQRADTLSVEEPLELRVGGTPLTVTMRTPGHDIELVHGFLLTEGLIRSLEDIAVARYCEGAVVSGESGYDENTYNVIDVTLAPGVPPPAEAATRNFLTSSSCGVCGKGSIEQLRAQSIYDLRTDPTEIPAKVVVELPDALRREQRSFDRTGGLHAAGLFTADGELLVVREDVGRHNAVDKVIGWALLAGRLPARGSVLMVSGRASFELTQKAIMAGIPCLAAVSAPSSLAVDCAEDAGMTLVGFVRGSRLNVYAGHDRVTTA
ncbi:formate dehydrogenase [Intrasporangium oryzae NRRL B-24470]|uniref:Sulfur carrier protein FdhD n=1 Tax=Intrasporangium oryzae NRRL B-24470 TaxID=1386089 RepID=W9G346_9MICO|nr:formate dehydrogenase accessory sulfurtransferase FdhD [Intrasporangium oryzae]EWS99721.1 formate dehydrogenase [Intrasporangium oryzae NRRL B-24470]